MLERELSSERQSFRTTESLSTDLMKEKALLEKTLETLRENSERQVTPHPQTLPESEAHDEMVLTLLHSSPAEGPRAGEQAPGPNGVVLAPAVPSWC